MQSSFFLFCFGGFAATLNAACTAILLLVCEKLVVLVDGKMPHNDPALVTLRTFIQQNTARVVITKLIAESLFFYLFLEAYVWYTN